MTGISSCVVLASFRTPEVISSAWVVIAFSNQLVWSGNKVQIERFNEQGVIFRLRPTAG